MYEFLQAAMTEWLRITEVYSPSVLEAGCLKSRCKQDCFLLRLTRFWASFPASAGIFADA